MAGIGTPELLIILAALVAVVAVSVAVVVLVLVVNRRGQAPPQAQPPSH